MRATSWILVVVALVVVGALGGLLLSGGQGEPRDLLESALLRFNGPEQDASSTLKELELALRSAEGESDGELAADILVARGRVLRKVKAFGPARADFERALERYRPGAVDIELEIVALDEEKGDLAGALARAQRITERDPTRLEAWTHAGLILTRMSENKLAEVQELCDSNLADEPSRRGMQYARRAAGMDADDPLRVSQLAGLRSLFTPPDQPDSLRALTMVDQASAYSSLAREALVRSFAGPLDRQGVESYLGLLVRSGRTQDAIDFGLAVAPQRSVNSSREFMEHLARVLIDAGRARAACDAIQRHFNKSVQGSQEFYLTWCEATYKAKRWKELGNVAILLRAAGDEKHRSIALFYKGMSFSFSNRPTETRSGLEYYARHDPVEVFPGALALTWRSLAAAYRTQGELPREYAALREAVRLEPDGSGEAWLRLFQIVQETEPESLNQAEVDLTRALCLLPARTTELFPTWLDVGRRRMRAAGTELELLLADQRKKGRVGPAAQAGPYELYRFGEMHRDAREPIAAAACARRLLLTFPGFVPAIDLLADSLLAMGQAQDAAAKWLEHVRHDPTDVTAVRKLAQLPPGTLTSEQLIELMQLDPENTGRLEVARTLKAEGRFQDALKGLEALPLEPLGEAGVLLASELLIDVGRGDDALAMLDRLGPATRDTPRVFELRIDAARISGKDERLNEILARPPAATPDPVPLVQRVDALIARGQLDPARTLLAYLDSKEETRTRDVLLRRTMLALYDHDMVAVQDELDRAEAFDTTGTVAFGRLLAVLESRVYNRLPIYVRAVYETQFQPTRLQAAILAILDERLEDARRMIDDARRKDPRDPHWAMLAFSLEVLVGGEPDVSTLVAPENVPETLFVLKSGDRNKNPRPLYARLLALDHPDWRLWAVAEFSRLKPTVSGSLWSTFEVGRGLAAARLPREAERTWRTLLRHWPTFEPAWDALAKAKLEQVKRFDHVDMVRLRADRRAAAGRRPGEEAEELLTEAWSRELAGNLEGALESVRAAVALDQELAPAWFKLGQLCHRVPHWEEAIEAMRQATRFADVESASPIAEEFIAVLRDARAGAPQTCPGELVRAELALLAERFPDDPAVALAQARAEIDQEDIAPAVRVARAYERLDRFRERIDDQAQLRAQAEADAVANAALVAAASLAARNPQKPDPKRPAPPPAAFAPGAEGAPPVVVPRPSLDVLRPGSTAAWKDFYEALEPARAEAFVRDELDRKPGGIELWRMLGETLVAQNRRAEAIQLFELVARMVPDGQTLRALALLYAETSGDLGRVEAAIAATIKLEGRTAPDLDLYYALARAQSASPTTEASGLQVLAGLWQQREAAIGRIRDIDIGQLYGTALVQRADPADRQLASSLLREVSAAIVGDRSRKNLVDALGLLAAQIPVRTR